MISMTDQELFHLLALQQVEGVGDIMAKKLINHCGSAEAVFKTKTSQLKYKIFSFKIVKIYNYFIIWLTIL